MMQFSERSAFVQYIDSLSGETIGFVPTMGALHEGHLSLVRRARNECSKVVVSIFVNPTQFNDKNDLKNYPRTESHDLNLLEAAGVDAVFLPSVDQIYPEPDTRVFEFERLDKVMEGATRPGHFNGVAQVVSRLFDVARPTKAYFGEKDFQQIAIIKAMVAKLGYGVEIVECPILRAENGLALSSRNALLTPEHKQIAPQIYAVLKKAATKTSELSPSELEKWVTEQIDATGLLKTIYFNIVDPVSLEQISSWSETAKPHGCIAVQAGNVRLIDNILLVC